MDNPQWTILESRPTRVWLILEGEYQSTNRVQADRLAASVIGRCKLVYSGWDNVGNPVREYEIR